MAKTFSGVITSTIQLTTAHPEYNPVLITGTVITTTNGVSGSGLFWTLTNLGSISSDGIGVALTAGGSVTNGATDATSASISSGSRGISIAGGTATVANFGLITSDVYCVYLGNGGVVTNGDAATTGASILGSRGVDIRGSGTVTNFGTILGDTNRCISMSGGSVGGTVINGAPSTTTALISGGGNGIDINNQPGAVTNFGTVAGGSGLGIALYGADGGSVTNGSSGSTTATISGGGTGIRNASTVTNFGTIVGVSSSGITMSSSASTATIVNGGPGSTSALISGGHYGIKLAGTVTNFGTIIGGDREAIDFGNYADRLIIHPGALFLDGAGLPGTVNAGAGNDTLVLAGTAHGEIDLTRFLNFDTVTVDLGGDWRVSVGLAALPGTIAGAGGVNALAFTQPGTFNLSGISGFPTIEIANSAATKLTLRDENFVNVPGGSLQVLGGSGGNIIDGSTLSGTRKFTFLGGSGADSVTGGTGTDTLIGGGGEDTLNGGGAGDAMGGGTGNDIYFFDNPSDIAVEFAGEGIDIVLSSVSVFGLAAEIENLTLTGTVSITGNGNGLANILTGNSGNNALSGGDGNDILIGDAGLDQLYGGTGNDVIIDDNGASSDMNGEAGDDSMTGGTGNDYMVGSTGNDIISGGVDGQDSLYGGDGNDYIVAADANNNGVGSVLDGGLGSNQLYALVGLGKDYAVGGELTDIIATGAGSDYIFGNAGDDTIVAGTGTDFIYGNTGNDFTYTDDLLNPSQDFIYVSGLSGFGTGVDTVADFTPGTGGDVVVVLQTPGVTTFANIQTRMSDIGVYTVVDLSSIDQVYLYNVDPFQLNANNFLFL